MKTDFVNGFAGQTNILISEFKGINLRLRFAGKKACAKATAARTNPPFVNVRVLTSRWSVSVLSGRDEDRRVRVNSDPQRNGDDDQSDRNNGGPYDESEVERIWAMFCEIAH